MAEKPDTIDSNRLKQLIDFNVPFSGYVDDGYGTKVFIDRMNIDINQYEHENVLHYSKTVNINVAEAYYTVKKGDNLTLIANKFGVRVDQIVKENGITTPNLIHPGDVINFKTDIQYGYSVNSMINLSDFALTTEEESSHTKYSSDTLLEGLNYVNSSVDAMAGALKKHAGKSTIGNNRKIYWEKPSGRAFQGNQYVKTYGLKRIGTVAKKATPWVAVIIEGFEVREGYKKDGDTFGHNTTKQLLGGAASIAGAAMGAKIGASFGTAIGVWFFGVGSIPGSIIGAFVGGLAGAIYCGNKAETSVEKAYDTFINPETKLLTP